MQNKKSRFGMNIVLVGIIIVLTLSPLILNKSAVFKGSDAYAEENILQQNTNYVPWFKPLLSPQSSEIESLFFALQASLGTGTITFLFGYWIGRGKNNKEHAGIESKKSMSGSETENV